MAEKQVKVWVQAFKDRPHLVLQWHDPDTGRRRSKSAGTADPKEAEQARADLEYELRHGKHQEASRMTWERFRELFEAEFVAGTRPNTRSNYQATLDVFETVCRPTALRGVNERTVSQFVAGLRKMKVRGRVGCQPSTIKVRLQFLRTALRWAAEQGLLPSCPKIPAVKVPKKLPRPVPGEAFERLLAKAPDDQTRAYLLCAWLGGMRLNEAYTLERAPTEQAPYVDWGRDRIVFPAAFVKAAVDQWVPLDPHLRQALEALPPVPGSDRVFRFESTTNRYGRRVVSASAVSDRVLRLAKDAGVKLSYHTLRKGFGCRYAGKVSAQVLQRLMRHSSLKMTTDYYVNLDDAVEAAVLGDRRNTSRNSAPAAPGAAPAADGASPSHTGS
jgi:integrase